MRKGSGDGWHEALVEEEEEKVVVVVAVTVVAEIVMIGLVQLAVFGRMCCRVSLRDLVRRHLHRAGSRRCCPLAVAGQKRVRLLLLSSCCHSLARRSTRSLSPHASPL